MARVIKINEENLRTVCEDFVEYLKTAKLSDGKVSFTKSIGVVDRKAELCFSEKAWLKMSCLVAECDKEVAWNGTAFRRDEDGKDGYYIGDIFVYPQEVTGANVTTDQVRYETWLYDQDTETFNNLRMQGHSHVNMGTTPSGVDISNNADILKQLEDDMFFIFMIWNKKGERNIKIYDMAKNILFESADITVTYEDDMIGLGSFRDTIKEMVKTKTYNYKPAVYQPPKKLEPSGEEEKKPEEKKEKKTEKRRGHRKTPAAAAGNLQNASWDDEYSRQYWMEHFGYYDEDDIDNPTGPFGVM